MTNDPGSAAFPPPSIEQSTAGAGSARGRSRRPLLIVGIVVVVLLVATGVFAVTRSTDEEDGGTGGQATLVRLVANDERLEVLGLDGEVQRSIDVPGSADGVYEPALSGRVVFDRSNEGSIVVVSVADGSIETYDVPGGDETELELNRSILGSDDLLVLDNVQGGDVFTLDLESGEFTSIHDALDLDGDEDGESRLIRAERREDGFVYFDAGSPDPVSVIVPADSTRAPWSVPGSVADLDGERTVSAEHTDEMTTISIRDRGDVVAEAEIDAPLRGGMLTGDDTALVVGLDGQLYSMSDGSFDELDRLDIDVQYFRPLGEDRLFVGGDDGQQSFVLDGSGEVVAEFDGVDDQTMVIRDVAQRGGRRCAIIQPGYDQRFEEGDVFVIDIESGERLAEMQSTANLLDTPDGCSAVSFIDETADAVLDGELQEFDGYETVNAVSADLEHLVLRGSERDSTVLIDVDSGDTTEIDDGLYAFVPG